MKHQNNGILKMIILKEYVYIQTKANSKILKACLEE